MGVRMSSKGRIVIPARLRRKYNLKPGDRVHLIDYGGVLAVVPSVEGPVGRAAGLLADGSSLIEALHHERLVEARGHRRLRTST
jgi:AbrB family looped-hinge helix DNA binding protein